MGSRPISLCVPQRELRTLFDHAEETFFAHFGQRRKGISHMWPGSATTERTDTVIRNHHQGRPIWERVRQRTRNCFSTDYSIPLQLGRRNDAKGQHSLNIMRLTCFTPERADDVLGFPARAQYSLKLYHGFFEGHNREERAKLPPSRKQPHIDPTLLATAAPDACHSPAKTTKSFADVKRLFRDAVDLVFGRKLTIRP